MPVDLDDKDIAILKSLMQDGRKSFRGISRELKISTPTVKARYERLKNIGLIKSVRPEIDVSKISLQKRKKISKEFDQPLKNKRNHFHVKVDNLSIKLECEFCKGNINGKPSVLKFANQERFFCCTTCRSSYKEKFGGRIQSMLEKSEKK